MSPWPNRLLPPLLLVVSDLCLCLSLSLCVHPISHADEPKADLVSGQQPPLPQSFVTNFQTDSRSVLAVTGSVAWHPGKLTLYPNATVGKEVAGNWRAKWQFDLSSEPLQDGAAARFVFQVHMGDRAHYWQLVWSQSFGQVANLALFETKMVDGQTQRVLNKQCSLPTLAGRFQLSYAASLLKVQQDGNLILVGYLNHYISGIQDAQWQCEAQPLTLCYWQQETQPALVLTEAQKQQEKQANQLNDEVKHLNQTGQAAAAVPLAQQSLQLRQELYGELHPETAFSYFLLGEQFQTLAKYQQAEQLYLQALAIREQTLGQDHPLTASILDQLAGLYHDHGKFAQAEPLYQRTLAIREEIFGNAHPLTAISLNNLAALYQDLGKYAAAELLYQRALAIREQTLGQKHPQTARLLNNFAGFYSTQGKYAEAELLFQRSLAIYEEILGKDHPQVARSLTNLANLNSTLGKYAVAESLLQRALLICEQTLGKEHPETARALNHCAGLYYSQGKFAEAEPLMQRTITICEQRFGKNHPQTAQNLNILADLYYCQGKYAQAELLFRRSLAIHEQVLGNTHLQTANSLISLARLFSADGKYAQAEPLCQRALAINEQVLGKDHLMTAASLNHLAILYFSQGRYAEAEPLFQRALAICEQILGEQHLNTAFNLSNLGELLMKQGKYTEAEQLFKRVLAIREQTLGQEHWQTARALNNLVDLNQYLGRLTQAEQYCQRALAINEQVLGKNHLETARSLKHLAKLYSVQKKFAEAESLLLRSLAIFEQTLGQDHPSTAYCLNSLALLYSIQKKYAQAEPLYRRAIESSETCRLLLNDDRLARSQEQDLFQSYLNLTILYLETNQPRRAWQTLEQSLGRGLLDELAAREQRLLTLTQRQQRQQMQALCRSYANLLEAALDKPGISPAQLEQWHLQHRRCAAELAQLQHELAQQQNVVAGQVYELSAIQAQLLPHQALVGWVDTWPRHYGYVVRATGEPFWTILPGSSEHGSLTLSEMELPRRLVAQLTAMTAASSANPIDLQAFNRLLDELKQQRLEPLQPALVAHDGLPAANHLIVLPAKAMAGMPVELLVAEECLVQYASSATLFAWLREQRPQRAARDQTNGLLALGDPVFEVAVEPVSAPAAVSRATQDAWCASLQTWSALPATRREVEQLQWLAQQHDLRTTILTGSDASEQALHRLAQTGELTKFKYLHFATHGLADDQFPLQSKLILARDQLPDPVSQIQAGQPVFRGELTAETILQSWELNADLAVLSACQSGLGQFTQSEGYLGLTQPLLLAGTQSAVVSLWNVEDTATALLMNRFYENLWGQRAGVAPMSKLAALQEAKQWLRTVTLKEAKTTFQQRGLKIQANLPALGSEALPYSQPHFWAAFILVGDWE